MPCEKTCAQCRGDRQIHDVKRRLPVRLLPPDRQQQLGNEEIIANSLVAHGHAWRRRIPASKHAYGAGFIVFGVGKVIATAGLRGSRL